MVLSAYTKEWILKAEEDYQTVIILFRQKKKLLPDVICFHAHQCAEKYLKSLLAKTNKRIPKTHDLLFLIEELKKVVPDLELIRDILRELNRYSVISRYPGDKATKEEARLAVKQLKQVREFLETKLI